jgi:short-subunit dehydrogenase
VAVTGLDLNGANVLVTGGSRGIGPQIARALSGHGARLALVARSGSELDAVAAELAADGAVAVPIAGDVTSAEDRWRVVAMAERELGPLDVLVNNAGVLSSGPFTGRDLKAHHRTIEVNVTGVLNGCAEGHRYLRRSSRGLLLNLCSASSLYGQPGLATYAASKAAVKSLTEALELEWRGDGVRVRSLLPLFVATDMARTVAEGASSIQRLGVRLTPDDVAEAAWRVVHERRVPLRGPHRPVGPQTRLLAAASAVSPVWAARLMTRRIAG